VDQGQSNFTPKPAPRAANNYGTFTLAGHGHWSYSADNTQTAIQQLGAGQSLTDSFTAVSSDGTASQLITVTINGNQRVPVLGGRATSARSPKNNGAAGVAASPDDQRRAYHCRRGPGQSNFKRPKAGTTGGNNYGTFTLAGDGTGSYKRRQHAERRSSQLGAGQSLTTASRGLLRRHRQPADHGHHQRHQRRAGARGVHIGAVTEEMERRAWPPSP